MTTGVLHIPGSVSADFASLRGAIDFQQRSVVIFNRQHPQPRLTRWYGPAPYRYSGLCWPAESLPPLIDDLRVLTEHLTGHRFNSVLCNLYRDGRDCVGWHADDEPLFGGDPVVASLSFGAARRFVMRRTARKEEKREMVLGDGSLLVMGRGVQREWQHAVPRTVERVGERVNLTFRWAMVPERMRWSA